MSDLFNHPILTVRIHAGFNANVFLAGLLALTGQTAGTAQAYMARRFPEVDAIIEFGPRAVNGILGHTLSIRTPHEHVHRTPADILRHYEASTLSDEAKAKAAAIWSVVANAEARVHGTTPDHVHFHEVGRMANIIAVGLIADFMTTIDPAMIVASPLPMTDGTVNCAHGVVPYPAPALYAMLDGVAVRPWSGEGEPVTPTGLAVLLARDGRHRPRHRLHAEDLRGRRQRHAHGLRPARSRSRVNAMTPVFDDPRLERLARKLSEASSNGAVTLAYSGGLDSRFLAFFAKLAGFRVRLLHVTGPHVAPAETAEAVAEARAMGLEAELVPLDPADMPDLAAAGHLRCYICKRHIFTELLRIAGDAQLCDGTNHSDLAVYRPGRKALEELGIRSPLAEADISKDEIRSLGAALGFRNPGQMARPCLLTRFPYGMKPASRDLILAADAEAAVEALMKEDDRLSGLRFRCRFPDGVSPVIHLERASVSHAEAPELLAEGLRKKLGERASGLRIELVDELSGWFDRPVRN